MHKSGRPDLAYAAHPERQFLDGDDFDAVAGAQIVLRLGMPDLAPNTDPEQIAFLAQNFTPTMQERLHAGLHGPVHGTNREKINPSREEQDGSVHRYRD